MTFEKRLLRLVRIEAYLKRRHRRELAPLTAAELTAVSKALIKIVRGEIEPYSDF